MRRWALPVSVKLAFRGCPAAARGGSADGGDGGRGGVAGEFGGVTSTTRKPWGGYQVRDRCGCRRSGDTLLAPAQGVGDLGWCDGARVRSAVAECLQAGGECGDGTLVVGVGEAAFAAGGGDAGGLGEHPRVPRRRGFGGPRVDHLRGVRAGLLGPLERRHVHGLVERGVGFHLGHAVLVEPFTDLVERQRCAGVGDGVRRHRFGRVFVVDGARDAQDARQVEHGVDGDVAGRGDGGDESPQRLRTTAACARFWGSRLRDSLSSMSHSGCSPCPEWMTTAGTVPSTADRSAMRSSACSMLWHAPGFTSRSAHRQASAVTSSALPRLPPVRAGPVMGLMPNHTSESGRRSTIIGNTVGVLTSVVNWPPTGLWHRLVCSVWPSSSSSSANVIWVTGAAG